MARRLRILVVDDERSVRNVVRRALLLDSHEVLAAASGQEALEIVERELSLIHI